MRVGKVGRRRAPSIRRRLLARDVRRNGISHKLPHANAIITPLHGHHATFLIIKRLAKRRLPALHAAARVVVVLDVARVVERLAGHLALAGHFAVVGRVQRHLVALCALVDALEHVNLAVRGPVRAVGEPERGPRRAAVGRVLDVEDEEALVVRLLGLDARGEAAGGGVDGLGAGAEGGVDPENGRVLAGVCEVLPALLALECAHRCVRIYRLT